MLAMTNKLEGSTIKLNNNDSNYNHTVSTGESPVQSSPRNDNSLSYHFREWCDKICASELYLSRKWWVHGMKYALREKFKRQQ